MTSPLLQPSEHALEVRTYFVRGRNALIARADFAQLFIDYYLHLADCELSYSPKADALLKEALAAITLHCACRVQNEVAAWTIHMEDPFLNLFVAGNNSDGSIIGTAFEEDIRSMKDNLLYADVVRAGKPSQRSTVSFPISHSFSAAEAFYRQSEQRIARYFQFEDEDYVLVTAQPDCDLPWLEGLTQETIRKLDTLEELRLLEKRYYRWHCGCTYQRILSILADSAGHDIDELFQTEQSLRVRCPRCGKRHIINREAIEAFLANEKQSSA